MDHPRQGTTLHQTYRFAAKGSTDKRERPQKSPDQPSVAETPMQPKTRSGLVYFQAEADSTVAQGYLR